LLSGNTHGASAKGCATTRTGRVEFTAKPVSRRPSKIAQLPAGTDRVSVDEVWVATQFIFDIIYFEILFYFFNINYFYLFGEDHPDTTKYYNDLRKNIIIDI